ncbi:uncharacterized protein [Montipora foliosa]|uniref:uncharacterized protein n=1 Tax=Montipora foliosa TaxID=591990 RepID=UPI0035F107AA
MAEASKKHLSHKCFTAALCNNRSDNRKDLVFHAFPQDQILRKTWAIKMKRGDKKFASNRALYCCSEHFVETDYRKSLTGARGDLVKNAVPSIFTWSDHNDEVSQRSERARIHREKTTMPFAGPLDMETESTTGTFEAMTASKNNPQEANLDAEIYDLRQRLSLSKFGLERFASSDDDIFFYTGFQSYSALIAFWNFVKLCSESLLSWNRARAKVNRILADTAFPYLQGQTKEKQRKREIQPIDQLWMFLTRVRLGLFERDLAHRFDVSVSTVSDVIVTWANYLYILLGSLPVWPSKEKIKEHLSDSFKGKYENVRGI